MMNMPRWLTKGKSQIHNSGKIVISLLLSVLVYLLPGIARASGYGSSVNVCNKGDVSIQYVAFATNKSLLGGHTAKISAWYTIEPNDCEDVGIPGYETVALGFLQKNTSGVRGNPVYVVENTTRVGSRELAPLVLCLPTNDRLSDDGSFGVIRDRYKPPCKAGLAGLKMSFGVVPNGNWPTINLTTLSSTMLIPWPLVATTPTASPQQSSNSMSGAEVAARVLLGAAQGLEKGRIRKIASVCESSILTMAFVFSKEGPVEACKCIASRIVRTESSSVVSGMLADIDANRDFDTVYGRVKEANLDRYMNSCLTPVRP